MSKKDKNIAKRMQMCAFMSMCAGYDKERQKRRKRRKTRQENGKTRRDVILKPRLKPDQIKRPIFKSKPSSRSKLSSDLMIKDSFCKKSNQEGPILPRVQSLFQEWSSLKSNIIYKG